MSLYSLTLPAKPTNLSGFCRIAFVEVNELAADGWPKVVNQLLQDDITLLAEHSFSTIPVLEDTLSFSDRPEPTSNGQRHESIITGRLPVALAARDHKFRSMQNGRWLCVGTDANGQQRIIGTPRFPAVFSYTHDNTRGRNEYVLQWRALTPHPAFFVTGVAALPPGTGGGSYTVTIDYPDGTEEEITVSSDTTVTPPHILEFTLDGYIGTVTLTAPSTYDGTFEVTAEDIDITGGTISSIVIDGGAPVTTFVGADISASSSIVITFTGTLTHIKLTFG